MVSRNRWQTFCCDAFVRAFSSQPSWFFGEFAWPPWVCATIGPVWWLHDFSWAWQKPVSFPVLIFIYRVGTNAMNWAFEPPFSFLPPPCPVLLVACWQPPLRRWTELAARPDGHGSLYWKVWRQLSSALSHCTWCLIFRTPLVFCPKLIVYGWFGGWKATNSLRSNMRSYRYITCGRRWKIGRHIRPCFSTWEVSQGDFLFGPFRPVG